MKRIIVMMFICVFIGACSSSSSRKLASKDAIADGENKVRIDLSADQAKDIYLKMDKSLSKNAAAKQSHTMGDWIEGVIICSHESEDPDSDVMVTNCHITMDSKDIGPSN